MRLHRLKQVKLSDNRPKWVIFCRKFGLRAVISTVFIFVAISEAISTLDGRPKLSREIASAKKRPRKHKYG
jgi:hypothetical protein